MYTARVSSPGNQENLETAPRLLKYLIKHKHWSPFELADMTVEITTSRAVAAQILRHRSFSFQEFSQRYAEVQSFEVYKARRQDATNRQNSIDDLPVGTVQLFENLQQQIQRTCQDAYKTALGMGVAKEQARFLLPLSATTRIYMKGSLRSWIHYFEVRCAESTQKEHREIAEQIREIFKAQFPTIAEALEE